MMDGQKKMSKKKYPGKAQSMVESDLDSGMGMTKIPTTVGTVSSQARGDKDVRK